MPAAAVVGEQLFCMHGGLSPKMSCPEDVNKIIRPCTIASGGGGLLQDLVWSDPSSSIAGPFLGYMNLICVSRPSENWSESPSNDLQS